MSQKKLLAILGSPHEHGASAAMLDCATEAAGRAGWEVVKISLYREQIAFCSGCRSCVETGRCVQRDGMAAIEEQFKACAVVALSAPTYWANVPAAVKNLFDRLLGAAMTETKAFPRPRLSPNQRYLLLTSCNTPFPFSWLCGQSSGALRAMEEFFHTAGMKRLGRVVFAGAKGSSRLPQRLAERIRGYWQ